MPLFDSLLDFDFPFMLGPDVTSESSEKLPAASFEPYLNQYVIVILFAKTRIEIGLEILITAECPEQLVDAPKIRSLYLSRVSWPFLL
jgi:hypothetical protein